MTNCGITYKMCADRLSDCHSDNKEFDIPSHFELLSCIEIDEEEINIASNREDERSDEPPRYCPVVPY